MFYLNSPAGGGGETTFPLAKDPRTGGEARLVATPDGELHDHNDDKNNDKKGGAATAFAASSVKHDNGMPECSRGLRVKPFSGGGACRTSPSPPPSHLPCYKSIKCALFFKC